MLKRPPSSSKLAALGRATGGDAPLPAPASVTDIEDIRARVGNDQLAAIREKAIDFEKRIDEWTRTKALIDSRRPTWELVERLAKHATGLAAATDILNQVDAVRSQRLLLEPTDPVAPLRSALAGALRKALLEAHAAFEAVFEQRHSLSRSEHRVVEPPRTTPARLSSPAVGLVPVAPLSATTDEALASALDASSLASRQAEADAVPGRVQKALEHAARLLEPKVRPVAIERTTLTTEGDVDAWLERQKSTLIAAIKDGPVLVS